jgi:hypothetical protein
MSPQGSNSKCRADDDLGRREEEFTKIKQIFRQRLNACVSNARIKYIIGQHYATQGLLLKFY